MTHYYYAGNIVEKAAKINSISQTADIVHPPSQPVPTREPPPTYSAAPLDPRKRDHDINMTAALNFIRNNEDKINQNALLSSAPPVEVGIKSLALQRLIRSQQGTFILYLIAGKTAVKSYYCTMSVCIQLNFKLRKHQQDQAIQLHLQETKIGH